jgi:alkanesulfonate monooxygenase SsuD/methylene tetrahydromethanopterin reductase-like flavin-dependent oxidoreductase (luciferase family)
MPERPSYAMKSDVIPHVRHQDPQQLGVTMNRVRKFSLFLGYGSGFSFPVYQKLAREAERLGFHTLWTQDNIVGHAPIPRDIEIFDTWSFLSAIAASTSRIRLGSMATPAIRRFAPLLAKTIASIDVISNGRVSVGLGAGDDTHQYEMIGQRFPEAIQERREILRETIEVMKCMWTQKSASYEGKHFRLKDAILSPKPLQKPGPPIYIACNTSKRLMPRLAAQQGDALAVMWGHDETVCSLIEAFQEEWLAAARPAHDYAALRSAFIVFCNDDNEQKARRNVSEITLLPIDRHIQTASQAVVSVGSDPELFLFGRPEQIAEQIEKRVFGLGFNDVMCSFMVCDDVAADTDGLSGWPGRWLGGMRLFAERVMPLLNRQP